MNLDNIFKYHKPTEEQVPRYEAIRAAGKECAEVIIENTEECADQTAAIRKLRECIMTANASIALELPEVGEVPSENVQPQPEEVKV